MYEQGSSGATAACMYIYIYSDNVLELGTSICCSPGPYEVTQNTPNHHPQGSMQEMRWILNALYLGSCGTTVD